MLRKNTPLNSLQTRKRLLITESEVNRAELVNELKKVKGEISHLKKQVRTFGSIASSAALAATAFSLFRKRKVASESFNGSGKVASWISSALAGARIGTSLFLKIKSILREREGE
jgi:hypothetical protein